MKWESSDLAVGVVVVAAVVILLGSFLWLSPAMAGSTYPLFTQFDRIDGVTTQSNVVLRGYTIGRVGAIEPAVADDGGLRFRVRLDIESELASGDSLLLPQGTRARLVPPPVIGAGYILLETPDHRQGTLAPGSAIPGVRSTAVLEQVQGITDDVSADALATMAVARRLMDSVTAAVGTANRTLTETSAAIPPLVRDLHRQLEATAALTTDIQRHVNTLSPAALATLDSVAVLVAESRAVVGELDGTLRDTRPDVHDILAQLDTTSILLTHFMREISEKPLRILSGVRPPPGLDPPPPGPPIREGSDADTVPELDVDTIPEAERAPEPDETGVRTRP